MSTAKRFRKKPVEIEAFEWDGSADSTTAALLWISGGGTRAAWSGVTGGVHVLKIQTLEGVMDANPGDFIIRGVYGEHYPCKPDIFAMTYDAV